MSASQAQTGTGRALTKVAVFDYDGTSIDGQSGSLFSSYLLRNHYISLRTSFDLAMWGARYVLHLPNRQEESRELIFAEIGPLGQDRVRQITREFHDNVLMPRYRADAIAEIARRRSEGCVCLIVSATFSDIASVAAHHMGADGYVATVMEQDAQGNYTGHVLGEVIQGAEKPVAAAAWADEHLGAGTWELAYAYGDHHSDGALLSAAREGFAVTPGKSLKSAAKHNDWTILKWS